MAGAADRRFRVALVACGTRGDFQPLLALAVELNRRGHTCKMFSDPEHCKMSEEWGVEAVKTNSTSAKELFCTEAARSQADSGDLMTLLAAGVAEVRGWEPRKWHDVNKENMADFKPDVVFTNGILAGPWSKEYAYGKRIPFIDVGYQPQVMATETMRPVPMFLATLKSYQPVVHLWLVYAQNVAREGLNVEKELGESGISMDDLEGAIMDDEYGVTPEHNVDVFFNPQDLPVPTILAYSETLFPKPHDWPETENLMVVGRMKLPPREDGVLGSEEATPSSSSDSHPEAVVRGKCSAFIAAGAAPVYVGWGSMVVESSAWMCRLAVGALKQAGLRGIIVSGWSEMTVESLAGFADEEELRSYCVDNVLFVPAVSHEWLFPQCVCALHHGGIGTLHASLEAGLPTLITPVFADQWDSGAMLARSGLGAATERTLRKVTAEELGEKLRACCEDSEMRANVRRVAAAMAKENAVGTVAEWLEAFLGTEGAAERWEQKCLARRKNLQARFRSRKHLPVEQVVSKIGFEVAARFPQIKAFFEKEQMNFLEQLEIGGRGCLFTVVPKSGLLVKEASSLDSRELGRLGEKSVVERLDEKGSRWRVRLLDGDGPEQGWISRTVAGKDMMKALSGMKEISAAQTALFMKQMAWATGDGAFAPKRCRSQMRPVVHARGWDNSPQRVSAREA